MSISKTLFTDNIRCDQQDLLTQRYNRILNGINSIISIDLKGNTEEELRNAYLSVILEITDSQICFIGEVDKNGLLNDITISDLGCDQRNKYDKSGHKLLHRDFILNCLYGGVINSKKGFFTNDPLSLSKRDSVLPDNSPLTSFLGVPLIEKGKAIGMLAVANCERGYSCEQLEDLEAIVPAVMQVLQRIKEERERKQSEIKIHDSYEQIRTQSEELQMQNEELQAKSVELEKANNALMKSVDRFRALVTVSSEAVYYMSSDWNEMCQLSGKGFLANAEKPSKTWLQEYILQEDQPHVTDVINEAIRKKSIFELEHRVRQADGSVGWTYSRAVPILDTNGEIVEWFGAASDITERKQEEHRNRRHSCILEGINRIFSNVVEVKTEEELGNTCLSTALDLTGGGVGFVNLLGNDGLMHDIAISEGGWEQCIMNDQTGHRRPPGNFIVHGLYGHVVKSGKGFFTNSPQSHPASIGLPHGHPSITAFLAVPLVEEGKAVGMLGVGNREGGYSHKQLEDLEAIAPAVTQSLKRKREEKERKQIQLMMEADIEALTLMHTLSGKLIGADGIKPLLQEIMEGAVTIVNAKMGTLQLLENDSLKIVAHCGHQQPFLDYFESAENVASVCGVTMQQRERIIVEDVETNSLFVGTPSLNVLREAGVRSIQSTPMMNRTGKLLGILTTQWDVPYSPNEHDLWRIDLLARQAVDILEQARAMEALKESQIQLENELVETKLLQSISAELLPENNAQELYENIIDAAMQIMHSDYASIQMLYPEHGNGGELKLLAFRGFNPEAAKFWEWVSADSESCCGIALRTGKRVISPDVKNCDFIVGSEDQATYIQTGIRAVQTTPLVSRTGKLVGMISTHWRNPHEPSDRSLRLLDILARQAADFIERKKAEQDLKNMNETLEVKVQERTSELEKTYNYLKEIDIIRKQEIHHRIKNNLQVISSLLDLQAEKFRDKRNIEDSQVLEAFKESQDRVISMALIHEELHKGGKIDTLNFSSYIEELADNLFLSYRLGNEDISLVMNVEEDIYFDMDTAVPLGIIINELVSNSLKHAFTGRDKGQIRISLHREEIGECSTTFIQSVSDNGTGIPEDIEIEDLDSLGLQLVITLVDQLDGEFELKRDNGTEFIITFTVSEKDNLAQVDLKSQENG